MSDGILSGPLDIDASSQRGPTATPINVSVGMTLTHRGSNTTGAVIRYVQNQQIVLRDPSGRDHAFRPDDGALAHEGRPVALRKFVAHTGTRQTKLTASGSIYTGPIAARVARASRIYVEGIHDAELIEKVWGDDLRVEGIVIETMDGADDLAALVRRFQPGPGRRLGVLLDHLVEGTKESRLASEIDDADVLICGHPFIDVWQAVRPHLIDVDAWPEIPIGQPWKEGVIAGLGSTDNPGLFWKKLLGHVQTYKDLETPLITSVERLIDFVAEV